MNEISEALSQGNIPFVALIGGFLLVVSALCGHGVFHSLGMIKKDTSNGDWYLLFFVSLLFFLVSGYWGWYFMTDGSM